MTERPLTFERTIKALADYDASQPERDAMLDAAVTNEEVRAWMAAEDEAEDLVKRAFWEDTRDRNRLEVVMQCMSAKGVREFVSKLTGRQL